MIFNRKYYKICFIIYMFINTLALGYFGIEINYMFIPLLLWAILIVAHDIYQKEFNLKNNYSLLMIGQGIVLILATLINNYSDLSSYVIASMQLVIYLVIFNNPLSMSKDELKAEIKLIVPLVNLLVGLGAVISLGMYVFNFSGLAHGWTLGMVGSRLFGVYFNSNPAAFLACITVVLALIAIRENFKGKPWYIFNVVIQIIYILLTKCRSALIILIIIVMIFGYYFLIRRKPYSFFKRSVLVSGLIVAILAITSLGHLVIEKVPQAKNLQFSETSRFQMDRVVEAWELLTAGNRNDFNRGLTIIDEVSNGRISLTKTALEIWQNNPLVGIGANNFKKIGSQETDTLEFWAVQVVHSHNVFLESLVATGIIGFVLFMAFFVKSVQMIFSLLKMCQGKRVYFIILMAVIIVLTEFVGSLSDYGVFYIYSLSATLAWCFLGYLYTYKRILYQEIGVN